MGKVGGGKDADIAFADKFLGEPAFRGQDITSGITDVKRKDTCT